MHSEVLAQTDTLQIFFNIIMLEKIRSGLQCIIPRIKFLKKDFLKHQMLHISCTSDAQ